MVFMTVGQEDPFNALFVFQQKRIVGDHGIDPQHIVIGKFHAAVNDNHTVAVANNGHVIPDFTEPAKGY